MVEIGWGNSESVRLLSSVWSCMERYELTWWEEKMRNVSVSLSMPIAYCFIVLYPAKLCCLFISSLVETKFLYESWFKRCFNLGLAMMWLSMSFTNDPRIELGIFSSSHSFVPTLELQMKSWDRILFHLLSMS